MQCAQPLSDATWSHHEVEVVERGGGGSVPVCGVLDVPSKWKVILQDLMRAEQ